MSDVSVNAAAQTLLETQTNLVLGTVRRDGSPQISPVWYLWKDATFVVSTNTTTAKWWNLKRDPRCSVCVDDPETGRMVVAYGAATLDEDDVRERTRDLVAKYYPGEPELIDPHMSRIFDGQKRVLITLKPDHIITRQPDE